MPPIHFERDRRVTTRLHTNVESIQIWSGLPLLSLVTDYYHGSKAPIVCFTVVTRHLPHAFTKLDHSL